MLFPTLLASFPSSQISSKNRNPEKINLEKKKHFGNMSVEIFTDEVLRLENQYAYRLRHDKQHIKNWSQFPDNPKISVDLNLSENRVSFFMSFTIFAL